MARIQYGAIVTDIAGSIGGITFQKNGSGTIARLKPRKTKTNTQKQRDQQPRLKQVQAAWNTLTLVNKVLWNDFAAANMKIGLNGAEKKLTGYQWFLTINENRLLIEQSILSVPPIYEIINPIDSINFVLVGESLRLLLSESVDARIYPMLSYSSFFINSASIFNFNKNRFLGFFKGTFTSASYLTSTYESGAFPSYYKTPFPSVYFSDSFYMMGMIRFLGIDSGISSLAYTAIAKFVWDGTKYVVE